MTIASWFVNRRADTKHGLSYRGDKSPTDYLLYVLTGRDNISWPHGL
jgi:hypothetical protein